MVKQNQTSMDSSRKGSEYQLLASVVCGGSLPTTITVEPGLIPDERAETDEDPSGCFTFSGTLGKTLDVKNWRQPPHVVFANLRTEDPQSVKSFIERYGVLWYSDVEWNDTGTGQEFRTDNGQLGVFQEMLRRAWDSDSINIVDLEYHVEENMHVSVLVHVGSVSLRTKDLWTFICFLFLWDRAAEKIGVCAHPDCPAPYFRKKRNTQKYCEAGPCTQFAQQQYSLDWWNRIGNKRRLEKLAKRNRRKRREKI
jgi:hypothetical protein